MSTFPDAASWRAACAGDASLAAWAGPGPVCFAIASGADTTVFSLVDGGPAGRWRPRLHVSPRRLRCGRSSCCRCRRATITASSRCTTASRNSSIQGDQLVFMQHAHVVRRVLEIGKWLALGNAPPVPVTLAPREGPRAVPKVQGGYVPVTVGGVTYQIYLRDRRIGARRAVHAYRRFGWAAVPWADGGQPHHRRTIGWSPSTCHGMANRRRRRAQFPARGG